MDLGNLRVILGYFFKANPMVRSLYTSADMQEDLSITFDLVDRIRHVGGHFGVV